MAITATQLLETVEHLAETFPETTSSCKYFNDDNTPCCIVGHALVAHGITAKTFEQHGDFDELNVWTSVQGGILCELGVTEDDKDAVNRLAGIQLQQDNGKTWGEALDSV